MRVLEIDRATGILEQFHFDEMTKQAIIKRTQPVDDVLNSNQRLATMNDGFSPSREIKRVASIPVVEFERQLGEMGLTYYQYSTAGHDERAAIRQRIFLNGDNAKFLTSPLRTRKYV